MVTIRFSFSFLDGGYNCHYDDDDDDDDDDDGDSVLSKLFFLHICYIYCCIDGDIHSKNG